MIQSIVIMRKTIIESMKMITVIMNKNITMHMNEKIHIYG
jgi:hypothetical protein